MLKKFGLTLLTLSLCAVFSAALFAQDLTAPPVTQADVDLFIKVSLAADPVAKQKLITDAGSDPVAVAVNQGKIGAVAGLYAQGLDSASIKAALDQNPTTAISDDEIKLLEGQKAAIVDAFNVTVQTAVKAAQ